MREILFPAHRLLHDYREGYPTNHISKPLSVPSETYDNLRATLVQAELMLLRVLGFELRIPLPHEFVPRYLARALEEVSNTGEDYDSWRKEEKEEYGVVEGMMETGFGRDCKAKAVKA